MRKFRKKKIVIALLILFALSICVIIFLKGYQDKKIQKNTIAYQMVNEYYEHLLVKEVDEALDMTYYRSQQFKEFVRENYLDPNIDIISFKIIQIDVPTDGIYIVNSEITNSGYDDYYEDFFEITSTDEMYVAEIDGMLKIIPVHSELPDALAEIIPNPWDGPDYVHPSFIFSDYQ